MWQATFLRTGSDTHWNKQNRTHAGEPVIGPDTVPITGSPALSILLANSRRASLGRNLGKVERPGKAFPRFQRPQTNSPAVSYLMIRGRQSAHDPRFLGDFRSIGTGGGRPSSKVILLANSRRGSFSRKLGTIGRAGEADPGFLGPETNSPAVSKVGRTGKGSPA